MVIVVYTIVIGCIAMIKNPINCNSLINYKSFANHASLVIQKVSIKTVIVFIAGEVTA